MLYSVVRFTLLLPPVTSSSTLCPLGQHKKASALPSWKGQPGLRLLRHPMHPFCLWLCSLLTARLYIFECFNCRDDFVHSIKPIAFSTCDKMLCYMNCPPLTSLKVAEIPYVENAALDDNLIEMLVFFSQVLDRVLDGVFASLQPASTCSRGCSCSQCAFHVLQ